MSDFVDIGKSYGAPEATKSPEKYYPCIEIDLNEHPGLNKDIGETCVFVAKGKVTSKRLSENDKTMTLELREIGTAEDHKKKNEADQALEDLKNKKRY